MTVPKIDTNSWRLPRKAHTTPEASYTDDMYRRMGLPVDPNRAPTTGGSGLPTVDTAEWTLPSTAKKLEERQKTDPTLGQETVPGSMKVVPGEKDEYGKRGAPRVKAKTVQVRKGAFKLSQQSIDLFKKGGITVDKTLFKNQEKLMYSIPREKLPMIIGETNIPDAQDELNRNPKGSIQKFMRNLHKASPKAGKMLRAVPENAAIYFYVYALRLSGRDMADEILKRYLTTHQAFKPVQRESADVRMQEVKTCKGSFLKKRVRTRKGQDAGPPRAADDDDIGESVRSVQRRLAGLEMKEHLEFATGTPYREMPSELNEFDPVKALMSRDPQTAPKGSVTIPKSLLKRIDGWTFERPVEQIFIKARRGPIKKADLKKVIKSLHFEIKSMRPSEHKDKARYEDLLRYLKKLAYGARGESALPHEQQALAGMTESVPLPHPMGDTRSIDRPKAYGILDDGADDDAYIDQVLAESRWFFRDFGDLSLGVFDPLGEAPGGRAAPWSGSDDEPAPTPIVRKGKVHGSVGKHASPEEKGEVDVGKSEIDYDHDEGDDEDEKAKGKKAPPKKKAKAEFSDEEPGEKQEAEETKAGRGLRFIGRHMKAAGGRVTGAARGRLGSGRVREPEKKAEKAKKKLKSTLKKPKKPSVSKPKPLATKPKPLKK